MLNKSGYKIKKPHVRIGSYYLRLKRWCLINKIIIVGGDLLISNSGHDVFKDADWDAFHATSRYTDQGLYISYWSPRIFDVYGEYIIEDDSLFGIFFDSEIKQIKSVYSIWDNSNVEVYNDDSLPRELYEGLEIESTEFPGIYGFFNKLGKGDLDFVSSLIAGDSEQIALLSRP